jgi:hypothetical protein
MGQSYEQLSLRERVEIEIWRGAWLVTAADRVEAGSAGVDDQPGVATQRAADQAVARQL